jgi:hypothetical protein
LNDDFIIAVARSVTSGSAGALAQPCSTPTAAITAATPAIRRPMDPLCMSSLPFSA